MLGGTVVSTQRSAVSLMKKRPAHNIYSSGSYGIAHNTQIHNQTCLRLSPLHLGGRCGEPLGGVVDRRAKMSTGFMASCDTNFSGGRQTQCEAEIIRFQLRDRSLRGHGG